jgi:hypothetical protein
MNRPFVRGVMTALCLSLPIAAQAAPADELVCRFDREHASVLFNPGVMEAARQSQPRSYRVLTLVERNLVTHGVALDLTNARDRDASARHAELLRSVQDELIAAGAPGIVRD